MADKYINETGLQTIKTWIEGKFALDSDLDTLSGRVDDIVSEGGEPNVIETVKVNGNALTPDANKAVEIETPTISFDSMAFALARGIITSPDGRNSIDIGLAASNADHAVRVVVIDADSDITREKWLATIDYVDTNGGKIDKIKVNGTEQTITNKEVDLTVPSVSVNVIDDSSGTRTDVGVNSNGNGHFTILSDSASQSCTIDVSNGEDSTDIDLVTLNNLDSRGYQTATNVATSISTALANSGDAYQTASDVSSAISTAVASAYKYKGSVATVDALPSSDQTVGDVYDVQATGMNYAWNGTTWDALGQYVDTSVFWTSQTGQSNTLEAMTVAEINAILNPSA